MCWFRGAGDLGRNVVRLEYRLCLGGSHGRVWLDLFVAYASAREETRAVQLVGYRTRPFLESYSGFDAEDQSVGDAIEPVRLYHILKVRPKVEIRGDLNLMIDLNVGFIRL